MPFVGQKRPKKAPFWRRLRMLYYTIISLFYTHGNHCVVQNCCRIFKYFTFLFFVCLKLSVRFFSDTLYVIVQRAYMRIARAEKVDRPQKLSFWRSEARFALNKKRLVQLSRKHNWEKTNYSYNMYRKGPCNRYPHIYQYVTPSSVSILKYYSF